jgi:hypothetical protein
MHDIDLSRYRLYCGVNIMGMVIKPSDRVCISVLQLESGNYKIWIDKVMDRIIKRIPERQ